MPERLAPKSTVLSSRAQRGICFFLVRAVIFCLTALFLSGHLYEAGSAAKEPSRPRILGIAGVTISVSDLPSAGGFYEEIVDPRACNFCEKIPSRFFVLRTGQQIELEQAALPSPSSLLAEVSFRIDDLEKLRKFLTRNKIAFEEKKSDRTGTGYGTVRLVLHDPEGHRISFGTEPGIVEPSIKAIQNSQRNQAGRDRVDAIVTSRRMIHAGFVVHNRPATEHFYKDILGFRPYWHGGMKDDQTDWLDLQVPDGTDWIEFMLNVPANADKHTLGVMNHIALGVPDIHAAAKQLLTNGMKLTEEPQIGRDGKWQLNLYDPDDTRVELMEFTPVEKPCCSDYTGPHPKL